MGGDDDDDGEEEEVEALATDDEIDDDDDASVAAEDDEPLPPPIDSVRVFANAMERVARRTSLLRDGTCAIPALLGVVLADSEAVTTLSASRALCGLMRGHIPNRRAAHDGGAVRVFVAMLSPRSRDATPEESKQLAMLAAQALSHLSADDPELANRVRLGGAVPLLIDGPIARCGDEPAAAAWAAQCFAHMASSPGGCVALAAGDGVIEALCRLLDFAVPWVAGIDSPRRTSKPTAAHKRAGVRAAAALLVLMEGCAEGARAVSDVVSTLGAASPRIGTAIAAASKALLHHLQASARSRLEEAKLGNSQADMKAHLAFSRAVMLPKNESGAARHVFVAQRRKAVDMKRHPWRYANEADELRTSGRGVISGGPLSPALASPRRAASPQMARGRDASPRTPRGGASVASPRSAWGGGGGGHGHGQWGSKEARSTAPAPLTPRGLSESDDLPTGEFRLRSRSPMAAGAPHAAPFGAHMSGGGMSAQIAYAESRLEAQLSGVRALLHDSIASVQREHEGLVAELRSDNRRLHADLAAARSKEAEYEEKLSTFIQAGAGLATWANGRNK